MKNRKTVVLILIVVAMLCLPSCSKKEETSAQNALITQAVEPVKVSELPEPVKELTIEQKLVNDSWCFRYHAEGYGDYSFFFHFYEEDSFLGRVFYAGFANNKSNFAGIWSIINEEYSYAIYKTREDAVAKTGIVEGTAPYTVILSDWDKNEMGRIGFDGEYLYNAQDKSSAKVYSVGSTPYAYVKNDGKYDDTVNGEMPVKIIEFVSDNDVTSTIQINHNHTYTDLVASMIEGTWTATNENGSSVFIFKPNDATDTPAVLVVAADKQSAVYTAEGAEPIRMSIPKPLAVLDKEFEGIAPTSYGKDATLILECMSDGSCSLIASIFGNSMELDKGTYSVQGGYKYSFEFEKVGHIDSAIVERSVILNYSQNGTKLGDVVAELKIKK